MDWTNVISAVATADGLLVTELGAAPRILAARDLATTRYNLREIAKELVLLEAHLTDPEKLCPDCVMKHALALEAYADEARRMGPSVYEKQVLASLVPQVTQIQDFVRRGADYSTIAPGVRALRKGLVPKVF
jgi:hypothetical protein